MSVTISRDEWLKALSEIGHSEEDDQEALTIEEFGAMFSMPRETAERRLKQLAAAGKATRTKKVGRSNDGRQVRYIAYRLA